jgi:hypothetical protein
LPTAVAWPWLKKGWAVLKHYRGLSFRDGMVALQKWIAMMQKRDSVKQNAGEDDFFIAEYTDYAKGKK